MGVVDKVNRTFCFIIQETVDFGDSTVESNDGEALVCGVQDEVLAHNGQPNEAEVSARTRRHRRADTDAGQACARLANQHMESTGHTEQIKTSMKRRTEEDRCP